MYEIIQQSLRNHTCFCIWCNASVNRKLKLYKIAKNEIMKVSIEKYTSSYIWNNANVNRKNIQTYYNWNNSRHNRDTKCYLCNVKWTRGNKLKLCYCIWKDRNINWKINEMLHMNSTRYLEYQLGNIHTAVHELIKVSIGKHTHCCTRTNKSVNRNTYTLLYTN